ncbi:MAG: hypothetical protein IPG32_14735 [Saprospirales bacterium]|nr:hypothetical protein [Saprospirales bacterium]
MQKQNTTEKRQALLFTLLRISFGVIYTWFGMLKFFPGISPAEDLARKPSVPPDPPTSSTC